MTSGVKRFTELQNERSAALTAKYFKAAANAPRTISLTGRTCCTNACEGLAG